METSDEQQQLGKMDTEEDLKGPEDMDEDDDDDEDQMEAANLARLKSVNFKLESNPFDYDSHKTKISLLQALGDLDGLRQARERFSTLYPLAPDLWLDWLRDESNLATTHEEKLNVINLFKRATKDYIDPDVWIEYMQFSLFLVGNADGLSTVRQVMEEAVAAVGLHVTMGNSVWEVYRSFEMSLVGEEEEKKRKVDKLFKRQLSLPLLDMESTLNEYKAFLGNESIDNGTLDAFKKALDHLAVIEPFERRLKGCSEDSHSLLKVYNEYIEQESNSKLGSNLSRMQLLHERRITQCCLHSEVWHEYLIYLHKTLKIKEVILSVNERSVRNCPWDEELWIRFMRSLELFDDADAVLKCFERALEVGFQQREQVLRLWLTLIDFRCKITKISIKENPEKKVDAIEAIRSLFVRAVNETSALQADPEQVVRRTWANFEARFSGQMNEARRIWAEILKLIESNHTSKNIWAWLEYINLERSNGDIKHLRKLLLRAFDAVEEWHAHVIGYYWLQLEREEGSLEQVEICEQRLHERLKYKGIPQIFSTFSMNVAADAQGSTSLNSTHFKANKKRNRQHAEGHDVQSTDVVDSSSIPAKKRAVEDTQFKVPLIPSKPKSNGRETQSVEKANGNSSKESFSINVERYNNAPPFMEKEEKNRTVFLSNLDYEASEDQLKSLVSSWGTVEEVRLVMNPKNQRSRGFAYVKFSKEREAQEALKLDRGVTLNSRPIFVSAFDEEKKGHIFGYNTELEKNKLFIRGLDKTVTKEDLENVYSSLPGVKEVRLVVNKNGQSKCVAYVDFVDESSASKALFETDGKELKGKSMQVAISNPPMKKPKKGSLDANLKTERANNDNLSTRPKERLAFLPRSVTQKGNAPSNRSNQNSGMKKSNEDFRKLLLGTKK